MHSYNVMLHKNNDDQMWRWILYDEQMICLTYSDQVFDTTDAAKANFAKHYPF